MQQHRLFIFLGLMFLVLTLHQYVTHLLWPPKPRNVAMQEAEKAKAKADAAKKKAADAAKGDPAKADPAKVDPAKKGEEGKSPDPTVSKPPQDAPVKAPPAWVALGSLDPTSEFQMLVTLNNQGAALERAELNKYFELEDPTGYLGHLKIATSREPPGCLVRLVGAGTPAAKAGLQVGDVITTQSPSTSRAATPSKACPSSSFARRWRWCVWREPTTCRC
jgi:hypothetical protein